MRKTLLIIFLVLAVQSMCHAVSVEITTGGGGDEGIKASSGDWLKDASLVQVLSSKGGGPGSPQMNKSPSYPDEIVATLASGYNFPFDKNKGKFDFQIWAEAGDKIYVRAWDEKDEYGDSEIYVVKGVEGEVWNLAGENSGPALYIDKPLKSQ